MAKRKFQIIHDESALSTTSMPRKKFQYRLFYCKLCPDHIYSRGHKCKIKAQKTVARHIEEEHPDMKYEDLVVVWGHMVHYSDGTCARVPLSESKVLGQFNRLVDKEDYSSIERPRGGDAIEAPQNTNSETLHLRVSASAPATARTPSRKRRFPRKPSEQVTKVTTSPQTPSRGFPQQQQPSDHFQMQTSWPASYLSFESSSPSVSPFHSPIAMSLVTSSAISYQPTNTSTTLPYHTAGPIVFPQMSLQEMHPLDAAAVLGTHGEDITALANIAFFRTGINDRNESRSREHQFIMMMNYLRVQRDYLTHSTPVILPYHITGPAVFLNTPLQEMHSLDVAAILGNQGEEIAALAGIAFFGAGADDENEPRSREQQMIAMVHYLRVQRDWMVNSGDVAWRK